MVEILTKKSMYAALTRGDFGNTVPQFFSVESWKQSIDCARYSFWGIRSCQAGGDRRCRLNVPSAEVEQLYRMWFPGGGGNISPMIDCYAMLRAEVIDTKFAPTPGLNLHYVPPGSAIDQADPWRGAFRQFGQRIAGLAAVRVLQQSLWPADLDDLRDLLQRYPEHTIELSACDRAVGQRCHRNTIIWEVRKY